MPRLIDNDTKRIKVDLERIVERGEKLVKSQPTCWNKLKSGFALAATLYSLYDEYQSVHQSVQADSSVVNKKHYQADVIRESGNYLTKFIIDRYLK